MFRDFADRMNRYKLRSRVVLAYILLSLFTTVSISFTIYGILANNLMKRIGENSVLSLRQSAYAADTLYRQLNTVMSQMTFDNDILNFIYERSDDKATTYRASLSLSKLESVYPFIQSIEIYNPKSGVYFNTLRPGTTDLPVFMENGIKLFNQLGYQNLIIIPRKLDMMKGTVPKSYQVLSFVFRPSSTINNNAMIILNLDTQNITDNILSYNRPDNKSHAFMMDANSTVIADNQQNMFMSDVSADNYLKLFAGGSADGYISKMIGNTKYLISYTKSSAYDWYFISVKPYDTIIGGLSSIRNIAVIASICTFLIALIISVIIMRNIYNPFLRLLDKMGGVPARSSDIELLTVTFSKSLQYQKSHETHSQEIFLHQLISGTHNQSIEETTRMAIAHGLGAGDHCIVLFKTDDYLSLKDNSPQLVASIQINIINAAREVLSHCCQNLCISYQEDEIIALCSTAKPDMLRASFREILGITQSLLNVSLSCAISDPAQSLEDISAAYVTACKRMRFRQFIGHGCFLDGIEIQPYLNNDMAYPYEIEADILKHIQTKKLKLLDSSLGSFRDCLMAAACDHVHHYAMHLAYTFLKYAGSLTIINITPYDLIQKIATSDTIDEISQHLKQYAHDLIISMQDVRLSRSNQKHVTTVDDIKRYIKENYNNSNLSPESLAEVVNLSPEYISKLFRQIEGNSVSHYLNNMRLETACNILENTDIPAIQIGERVGFLNTTYFFTLFKKTYGMTPAAFREQQRGKHRPAITG